MNKRDKFWINNLLCFAGIILIFTIISLYNVLLFNKSYMQEEKSELQVFQKQIEWAIKPYLANKDYANIKKYCEDFSDKDINIGIFDNNKNLIASTNNYIEDKLSNVNSNNMYNLYKNSVSQKMIGDKKILNINGEDYYLELTISEEDVMKSIVKAEKSIWYFFTACLILIISLFVYIIQRLRVPFNKLQDSITQVANGNLDTNIEVPSLAILQELACSIKKMAQRLKKQIKRLKELEEYKSEFIQNVSHEIKTPVTAINSAVQLIDENNCITSLQDKECFNIISYQTKQINNLVNDILNISEIESERNELKNNFQNINLNKIIKEVIDFAQPSDIVINFYSNDNINCLGNERLITQAITNLITNAVKYSSTEKIDISLKQMKNFISISIKDYGIGISEEHKDKIFEKFYRVDKARSRKFGGTGLGLSIVKNIVELHNGLIELKTAPNQGCEFIITLPNQ